MTSSVSPCTRALFVAGLVATAALGASKIALAHEFWIAPQSYQIDKGASLIAELRQGQNFIGGRFSFLPARFFSFDITNDGKTSPVPGRLGDLPAIKSVALEPGLNIITHYSRPTSLTYEEFAKFEAFVKIHGLDRLIDRHRERRLPEQDFLERYRRTAKSLVQVGAAGGSDVAVGMPYEIVAEANPYQLEGVALPVRLLWRGEAEPATVIQIFVEGSEAGPEHVVTDEQGGAVIPVKRGTVYLLNAVHMVELDGGAEDDGGVWESYWASLTFAIPQ